MAGDEREREREDYPVEKEGSDDTWLLRRGRGFEWWSRDNVVRRLPPSDSAVMKSCPRLQL